MRTFFITLLILLVLHGAALHAKEVFLDEEFTTLARWEPFYFSNIEQHSSYTVGTFDGKSTLMAASTNSASAMLLKGWFNIYDFPRLVWRFRVSNIFSKGDSSTKGGDDYPIRLYVMFKFDPVKASFGEKIQYELARVVNGKYPPHTSLNYIWANKQNAANIITSPYSSRSVMIPVAKGSEMVGRWVEHKTNIVKDYIAAFGKSPPVMARIAVMSDADNTGESARAYIDYIRISSE